jgi:Trypsin
MQQGEHIKVASGWSAAALGALLAASALMPAQAVVGGTATTNFWAVGPTMGVQVAPDWVLTANHVALLPGQTFMNGYGSRTVAATYRAPGAGLFPQEDLALLRLVPATTLAPYLQISSTLFPEGRFAKVPATIVSGTNPSSGRGYAHNFFEEFSTLIDPDDSGPLTPVIANYLLSYDPLQYVEGGDSGGALFLGHVLDSVSPLLGITSARIEDENLVPIGSGFVELAVYRDWIDATMLADPADNQVLQWVSVIPEPPAMLLWAAGLVLLGRRAQRARAAKA